MPVTFAHPLAVAPLARTGLPLGALVIGTVVPDLPLFARATPGLDIVTLLVDGPDLPTMIDQYEFLHSLTGLVTVNIFIGLIVLALWWLLLRPAYRDALPRPLRERTNTTPAGVRPWLLAVPALLIGSLTHVVWDQLTDEGALISQRIEVLQGSIAGFPYSLLLQYASSLLGALGVLVWLCLRLARRDGRAVPQRRPELAAWMFAVPVLVAGVGSATVLYAASRNFSAASRTAPGFTVHDFAFDALTTTVAYGVCAAIAMAIVHRVSRARRARTGAQPRHRPASAPGHTR